MTLHLDVIGIDIAKAHLDVHDKAVGTTRRVANSAAMAAELAASLEGRDCLVVFEATGRYDAVLRRAHAGRTRQRDGVAPRRPGRSGAGAALPAHPAARPARRDALLAARLTAHIAKLDVKIASVEQAISDLVRTHAELAHAAALLRSAPGIGPVTAAVLIGQLPELGQTSAKAIAALAGPLLQSGSLQQRQRRLARQVLGPWRPVACAHGLVYGLS